MLGEWKAGRCADEDAPLDDAASRGVEVDAVIACVEGVVTWALEILSANDGASVSSNISVSRDSGAGDGDSDSSPGICVVSLSYSEKLASAGGSAASGTSPYDIVGMGGPNTGGGGTGYPHGSVPKPEYNGGT